MKVTKDKVAYKIKQGNGWLVFSYQPKFKMYLQAMNTVSYLTACANVREYKAQWDTKAQEYKEYTIYDIRYAKDSEENLFRVCPMYSNDALVVLTPLDDQLEEEGERFRIPKGDLFEDYNLFDQTMNLIHEMTGGE